MQHHPWILPWGVPLQKMVAVPMHPAHPGLAQPLHPVHVPPSVLGLAPTPLAALRTFVTTSHAAIQPPRPRKVNRSFIHFEEQQVQNYTLRQFQLVVPFYH